MSHALSRPITWVALASAALLGCRGTPAPSTDGTRTNQAALTQCPATPAPALFDNALCVCDDLALVGAAVTTHRIGQASASIGVNGRANLVGQPHVDGSFTAYGGIEGVGDLDVSEDVRTNGGFSATGEIHVGKDLSIGGDLMQVGHLVVDGLLRIAGIDFHVGDRQIAGNGPYATSTPPCGCDASNMLDIGAAVADAKQQNDNAQIGLAAAISSVGQATITLPTGIYYLDSLKAVGEHQLRIEGAVSLYVGGDIDLVGADQIDLVPGATLDLYVAGAVRHVGALHLGDAQQPAVLRLFVGGTDPVIAQVGAQELNGLIYAPKAEVQWVGETTVRGAVFAGRLSGVGDLHIEYDGGALSQPAPCDPTQALPTPGDNQPPFVK